jgi:VanZ family protein
VSVRERLSLWAPVVISMASIFFVSSMHQPPSTGTFSDKQSHAAAYGVLTLLLCRAMSAGRAESLTASRAVIAVVVAALYGTTDEWHQHFVPGRTMDIADLAADASGAAVAGAAAWAWGIIRRFSRGLPGRRAS